MRIVLKAIFLLFLAIPVLASGPTFSQLTQSQYKDVVRDFSAVTAHTSVSPASSLGTVFGFEVGLVAGAAQTPEIKDLANTADPGSDVSMLPNAGVLAAMTFPLGFTAEALILPKMDISGVKVSNTSVAVKWTFTDVFPVLPLDMALKLSSTSSKTDFSGTVPVAGNVDFNYKNKMMGVTLEASKKLTIFEPYANIGIINTKGSLGVSDNHVFDPSYTTGTSVSEKLSGMQYAVGANFNVLVMKLGIEAGKVFSSTRAAVKLSFYF
jgi:hypothetical protein